MRFSRALIPTTKEDPADAANVSHALLTRAGFIRRVGAGIYEYLPLGLRVLRKIEQIVRTEMDRQGALEVLLPALLPAEYFKETERFTLFGDTLFRLKDRKGAEFHLGPTHEEIITDLVRREIKSYRDLPKNLYQIQAKYRDEARPRGGLLRGREFLMKDAYSFDQDEAGARASYEKMREAYTRIFDRLGLTYRMVTADSGAMGGSTSAEFQILAKSGEDALVACNTCSYAANVEAAIPRVSESPEEEEGAGALARVPTPGQRSIEEVSRSLKLPAARLLKSLAYTAKDGPLAGQVFLCVVRGDHEVNAVAASHAAAATEVFLAEPEAARRAGLELGFAGPVGFSGKVFIDPSASGVRSAAVGANEADVHLTGVRFDRDFQGEVVPLRLAREGDRCPTCDTGILQSYRGIEGGHIFILGTHYSAKMGATFLTEAGESRPLVMGCYGIGISRLLASAVEQHHDEHGIRWPMSIAPYALQIVTIGTDAAVLEVAENLTNELAEAGIETLWDDRDERPGFKFKDADLIGIPLRVTIGAKGLQAGGIEIKPREGDKSSQRIVPLADAARTLISEVRKAHAASARSASATPST